MKKSSLTHIDDRGYACMVDVTVKEQSERFAHATGQITLELGTLCLIESGDVKKGDVLGTARIAGIMAAKRTHELIPLCHPLLLSSIKVEISRDDTRPRLNVDARVRVTGQTGVEMEALTAVSVACLTIYDMVKAVDRTATIGGISLVEKNGGVSGHFVNQNA